MSAANLRDSCSNRYNDYRLLAGGGGDVASSSRDYEQLMRVYSRKTTYMSRWKIMADSLSSGLSNANILNPPPGNNLKLRV